MNLLEMARKEFNVDERRTLSHGALDGRSGDDLFRLEVCVELGRR